MWLDLKAKMWCSGSLPSGTRMETPQAMDDTGTVLRSGPVSYLALKRGRHEPLRLPGLRGIQGIHLARENRHRPGDQRGLLPHRRRERPPKLREPSPDEGGH